MSADRNDNLVAGLNPQRERPAGNTRARVTVWITGVLLLTAGAALVPKRGVRGPFVVALLFLVIAGAIAWLSAASRRLSISGREMKDHINYDPGGRH